jgi:hypothetical protein
MPGKYLIDEEGRLRSLAGGYDEEGRYREAEPGGFELPAGVTEADFSPQAGFGGPIPLAQMRSQYERSIPLLAQPLSFEQLLARQGRRVVNIPGLGQYVTAQTGIEDPALYNHPDEGVGFMDWAKVMASAAAAASGATGGLAGLFGDAAAAGTGAFDMGGLAGTGLEGAMYGGGAAAAGAAPAAGAVGSGATGAFDMGGLAGGVEGAGGATGWTAAAGLPAAAAGGAGSGIGLNLSTLKNGASIASAIGSLLGTGATSPYNPADDLRANADASAARIQSGTKRINDVFNSYGDDYYNDIYQQAKQYYTPQLSDQYHEALRKLPMRFPTTGSSAFAREAGNLERDRSRAEVDVNNQAQGYVNDRRSSLENDRNSLVAQFNATGDLDTAAASAASKAKSYAEPPAFSPLGDLFQKYTGNMATEALVSNPNTLYQRPTYFGAKAGSARVVT